MSDVPPRRAERLVRWSLAPWERPAVLGDLAEEAHEISVAAGDSAARRWYWRQVIASVWPNVVRRLHGDARRAVLFRGGSLIVAIALAIAALRFVVPSRRVDDDRHFVVMYVLFGVGSMLVALFKKRVKAPDVQKVAFFSLWLVIIFGDEFGVFVLSSTLVWIFGVLLVAIGIWPWWPQDEPPREMAVSGKTESMMDRDSFLTVAVPNVPLGLSGLILCPAESGDVAVPRAPRVHEPTIAREFSQWVRVCAIVNVRDRPAHAAIDLVDATGRAAKHMDTALTVGSLSEVPRTWDDVADQDPPEHFGQIDAKVDLRDLPEGPYRLRVTVGDGINASVREESIAVRG